jgi:hypothetical protein
LKADDITGAQWLAPTGVHLVLCRHLHTRLSHSCH